MVPVVNMGRKHLLLARLVVDCEYNVLAEQTENVVSSLKIKIGVKRVEYQKRTDEV
jgi:hypothetical protein